MEPEDKAGAQARSGASSSSSGDDSEGPVSHVDDLGTLTRTTIDIVSPGQRNSVPSTPHSTIPEEQSNASSHGERSSSLQPSKGTTATATWNQEGHVLNHTSSIWYQQQQQQQQQYTQQQQNLVHRYYQQPLAVAPAPAPPVPPPSVTVSAAAATQHYYSVWGQPVNRGHLHYYSQQLGIGMGVGVGLGGAVAGGSTRGADSRSRYLPPGTHAPTGTTLQPTPQYSHYVTGSAHQPLLAPPPFSTAGAGRTRAYPYEDEDEDAGEEPGSDAQRGAPRPRLYPPSTATVAVPPVTAPAIVRAGGPSLRSEEGEVDQLESQDSYRGQDDSAKGHATVASRACGASVTASSSSSSTANKGKSRGVKRDDGYDIPYVSLIPAHPCRYVVLIHASFLKGSWNSPFHPEAAIHARPSG